MAGVERPCENSGISVVVFLIVSSLVLIILSTIDFHTGLVWAASPRVDAEVRYIVTIVGITVMFVYMYCQWIHIKAKVDTLDLLLVK